MTQANKGSISQAIAAKLMAVSRAMKIALHGPEAPDAGGDVISLRGMLAAGEEARHRLERQAADHLLQLSRVHAELGALRDGALDCIVIVDSHGRIVEFNSAAEAAFGRRRADVIGGEFVVSAHLFFPFAAAIGGSEHDLHSHAGAGTESADQNRRKRRRR